MKKSSRVKISIVMGSRSDWETLKEASDILTEFGIAHETKIVSAHRTPKLLREFAETAEARGLQIVIAGAGGSAHLPGMLAAEMTVPVLGVPVETKILKGLDSLLSIVQMPAGIPVGTLAIGKAGAKNAALFAIQMLAMNDSALKKKIESFRKKQTQRVLKEKL